MVINKTYDIGQLVETLRQEIELSKKYNVVKLDILTANDILEVLQETHRREQKHQTLESALTFIEKEDGTQTNLMEAETKCFGCYDGNDIECCMCDDMKQCEEETNRKPGCFGRYYTNCKQCDNVNCNVRNDCISETKFKKFNIVSEDEEEGETNE